MGDAGELLTDGDLPGAGGGWGGVLRDGWQFARALAAYRPRAVGLALLLLVAASVTEAFGILMLIPILHTVGAGSDEGGQGGAAGMLEGLAGALGVELTLPAALGAFVGLTVARSVIVGQRDVLLPKIRLGFVDDLRGRLHQGVAGARWQFLAGQRRSDFQHILTGEVPRISQATLSFLYSATAAVLLGVQLGIAFLISPAVSGLALGAGAALLLLTRPLVRRSQDLGAQVVGVNRTVFSHVMDFVTGLKLAKVQAREQAYVDRFSDALGEARRRQTASDTATAMSQMVLSVGGALALAGLAWFAIEGARLTLPELAVVTLVFARVMTAFTSLQRNGQLFANLAPSYGYALRALGELRGAAEGGGGDDGILRQAQDECLLGAQGECLGGAGAGLGGVGAGWDGGGAGWVVGGVRAGSDGVGMGMELKRGLAVRGVWFSYGDGGGRRRCRGLVWIFGRGRLRRSPGRRGRARVLWRMCCWGCWSRRRGRCWWMGLRWMMLTGGGGGVLAGMCRRIRICFTIRFGLIWYGRVRGRGMMRFGGRWSWRRRRILWRGCRWGWIRWWGIGAAVCRGGNGSGSRWRGLWRRSRRCWCWMRLPVSWMPIMNG